VTRFPNIAVTLLTDSNGRVGGKKSDSVGLHNTEKENFTGECFRLCIESAHLKAMNTYFDTSPTWFHIDGTGHRIDYVCLSESLATQCSVARTHDDIDISPGTRVDHFAVCAVTDLTLLDREQLHVKSVKPEHFAVNMDAMDQPYLCNRFQNRLWKFGQSKHADIDTRIE